MPGPPEEIEAAIDRLYQLPLGEFTQARNALAAACKAAGDAEGAARVKALAKPTAVAWAVNQVCWKERALFDAVVRAVAEVAAVQREALAGGGAGDLREAMRRKAEALQQAARAAERRLVATGSPGGPGVLQRLGVTLEALASPRPAGQASAPRPGRLGAELRPAGFDLALGLEDIHPSARPAADEPRAALPKEVSESQKAAKARLARAEFEAARLSREVQAAVRALGEAEQRAAAAQTDVATLEARLEEARARAAGRAGAESAARRRLEDLRASLAAAEAELETARSLVSST